MNFQNIDFNISQLFAKSCRLSALQAVVNANSGHPGGSFSSLDFLSVLYLSRLIHSNEKIVVSNGHISPAVYAVLSELKLEDKQDFIENFRQSGSKFEGHVNRFVNGCFYSTGPLGSGVAAALGMALAEKHFKTNKKVFAVLGDGECQEGIVYEMGHFASKYNLDNFVCLVDYNKVQLTDSLEKTMPIDLEANFKAMGFKVLTCNGHNHQEILNIYQTADKSTKPTVILMHTIMGKGSKVMQLDGENFQATWHGKSPSPQAAQEDFEFLKLSESQKTELENQINQLDIKINSQVDFQSKINVGEYRIYSKDDLLDCRTAYGNALKNLGELNPEILALTADLSGSVKTNILQKSKPNQHFEVGIAEQFMVAAAGGLSLAGVIPFASTFGVFMTSRARGQARLNDINETNVKMVSTHCGLSLGEDGPTHQALDDFASMESLFNTTVIEPADPNQTDHVIRYIAKTKGNFYVRLGRHKYPVLTDKNQNPIFNDSYLFDPLKPTCVQKGDKLTVLTLGSTSFEAQQACLNYSDQVEFLITPTLNSAKSKEVLDSLKKTKNLLIIQDHNSGAGLATFLAPYLLENSIVLENFKSLGVEKYQLSGKQKDLYALNQIDKEGISKQIDLILGKL